MGSTASTSQSDLYTLPHQQSQKNKLSGSKQVIMSKSNAPEEGSINWIRDIDLVFSTAKEENKPIFLLFNEIPGCSTCTSFGRNVLSNSSIVEEIENYFVAGLVNNRGITASDNKALRFFQEPRLNNPVVLFVDSDGHQLIPRKDGVYTSSEMKTRMRQAKEKFVEL